MFLSAIEIIRCAAPGDIVSYCARSSGAGNGPLWNLWSTVPITRSASSLLSGRSKGRSLVTISCVGEVAPSPEGGGSASAMLFGVLRQRLAHVRANCSPIIRAGAKFNLRHRIPEIDGFRSLHKQAVPPEVFDVPRRCQASVVECHKSPSGSRTIIGVLTSRCQQNSERAVPAPHASWRSVNAWLG